MAGMLEGLRVLDAGHVVAVPSAGAMLADWGADVVKVEPLSGELLRGVRKTQGVDRVVRFEGGEVNWTIELLNRNKKGMAVDLRKESGRDIFYKLVQKSDVFISNYELNSLLRLKLDYTTLSQLNPRLIYGVLTGYGSVGPDKDERGFDYSAAWARPGIQSVIGEPGSPPPTQRPGLMDRVAAAYVVAGVLAALLHREKTGKGQELEFSLYHTGVWTLAQDIQGALMGMPLPQNDRVRACNPLWNSYRTRDNRWFQLVMLQADLHWPDFCRAIERPELENDPRFDTMETREQNCEELVRIIDEVLASGNREEWEERFREHNCIYGRIETTSEVITDPQAIANDFFAEILHPVAGQMKFVTTPVKFRQNPASVRTPAPEVGQHTEEILLDLGYSWDDISRLKEQGVIL
ncbi:CaiB/BaiF CoA transferase family protein [Chloroflexota bacterium]